MGERPLWNADDQRSRLDELTASTTNPAKDLPLRRDVRLLGTLLGRVLVEQVGESLLGVVEELRRIFIQHREQPRPHTASPDFQDPLLNQARNLISRLSIDEAHRVRDEEQPRNSRMCERNAAQRCPLPSSGSQSRNDTGPARS